MTTKRLTNLGLDALTWLVLVVMLAPVLWLVASSLQTDGQLSNGAYDLLHPTFTAFKDMWSTVDFGRYLANSAIICTVAAAGRTMRSNAPKREQPSTIAASSRSRGIAAKK